MAVLAASWRDSLALRVGVAIGTITVLAIFSILLSSFVAENSVGKAKAINDSGSLRMLTYRLTEQLSSGQAAQAVPRINGLINQRLETLGALVAAHSGDYSALPQAYQDVQQQWHGSTEPMALRLAAADGTVIAAELLQSADEFFRRADRLTTLIEHDLENRILLLQWAQRGLLGLILLVTAIVLWMIKNQVLRPLDELLQQAERISRRDFSQRAVVAQGGDELARLGQAFNHATGEILKMTGQMEQLVAQKTSALKRSNRSLQLLYRTSRSLAEDGLSQDKLQQVLCDVEQSIGLRAGRICVHKQQDGRAYPVAASLPAQQREQLCSRIGCADCRGDGSLHQIDIANVRVVSVPLRVGNASHGVMSLLLDGQSELEEWQRPVLEAVGQHIAAALANAQREKDQRQLAVLEERTVMARELHDSLAQSLSYLNIQVVRLQSSLRQDRVGPDDPIMGELRGGLKTAYRQLRELLSTFRLKLDGNGLQDSLRNTAAGYSERTGIAVTLDDQLGGLELSANQEIHVLHVVREALSNIEHHAQANAALIALRADEQRRVTVSICDNGIGIGDATTPSHHFGLVIMQERADSLGGTLEIGPANAAPQAVFDGAGAQTGTAVVLRFEAGSLYS
jgi:two-component system, NarL family, nitrate/nitrite sensor histidine kinase NarX